MGLQWQPIANLSEGVIPSKKQWPTILIETLPRHKESPHIAVARKIRPAHNLYPKREKNLGALDIQNSFGSVPTANANFQGLEQ